MEVKPALFSKRDSCSRGQAKARCAKHRQLRFFATLKAAGRIKRASLRMTRSKLRTAACSRAIYWLRHFFGSLVFVVAAGGGMGGLVLAACVGIQAAFECDEIIEKLKRDEMSEGGEPLARFGVCFRDD